MTTKELIDVIFNDPTVKYDLTEFQELGTDISDITSVP